QRDGAELGLALRLARLRRDGRPGEGDLQQLAAADFAHRLYHQRVVAGGELLQSRVGAVELQRVLAGRARGSGDAGDRQVERAPGAAPPLAQVGVRPGAVDLLGVVRLVPDGEVGDRLVARALDPDRDVGTVVFGDPHLRDLDVDLELRGVRRHREQATEGDGELDPHWNLVDA